MHVLLQKNNTAPLRNNLPQRDAVFCIVSFFNRLLQAQDSILSMTSTKLLLVFLINNRQTFQ